MVDFLKKKWNKLSIIPTKKKLRANARSFFFVVVAEGISP